MPPSPQNQTSTTSFGKPVTNGSHPTTPGHNSQQSRRQPPHEQQIRTNPQSFDSKPVRKTTQHQLSRNAQCSNVEQSVTAADTKPPAIRSAVTVLPQPSVNYLNKTQFRCNANALSAARSAEIACATEDIARAVRERHTQRRKSLEKAHLRIIKIEAEQRAAQQIREIQELSLQRSLREETE